MRSAYRGRQRRASSPLVALVPREIADTSAGLTAAGAARKLARRSQQVIAVRFLLETVAFVDREHVPDRHLLLAHRRYDLLGLARRYARVVLTLRDEQRPLDLVRLRERRDRQQERAHVGIALVAVLRAAQVASRGLRALEKTDEARDADQIDAAAQPIARGRNEARAIEPARLAFGPTLQFPRRELEHVDVRRGVRRAHGEAEPRPRVVERQPADHAERHRDFSRTRRARDPWLATRPATCTRRACPA
jgi:hypothetical protein